ncbi:MAG: CPBP family intramembrane glutamic endopeptidase [Acidobacteriota bacterium]
MLGLPERSLKVVLRIVVFAILSFLGLRIFGWLLFQLGGGLLLTSALSVFLAAAAANAALMRIYEHARLADIGFAWNPAASRNLLLGLAGGVGAAAVVLGGPLALPAAELQPVTGAPQGWPALLFVGILLLFGGVGEEMLFHGYGFQVLLAALGPWATILPLSVLFALAHAGNLNISVLGALNTFGWGVLLGWAFWRSGDLWLPIGLHVGWNWMLPLAGANLSGFTMNVTGYAIRWSAGPLWSGGEYGPEGSILTSAILLVLFLYLRQAPIRRQTPLLLRTREEV